MNIVFSSVANPKHREAVEALVFFNPQQSRARKGILKSIERFGHPQLCETPAGLTFRVGVHEAQTLFAYNKEDKLGTPLGLVIFLRCSERALGIAHLVVQPQYASGGICAGEGLAFKLIDQVRLVGRRIRGVEEVLFFYQGEHGLPV